MKNLKKKTGAISSAKSSLAIIITFAILISLGTFLLLLPISSKGKNYLTFQEALFTATSCSCVTGLTLINPFERLNAFGLIVQMVLSQIGGIGIITVVSFLMLALNQKISQNGFENAKADSGYSSTGELGRVLVHIIKFVFFTEGIFVLCFFFIFLRYTNFSNALFNSFYHTIMSFCNSGFDIFDSLGGVRVLSDNNLFKLLTIFAMFLGSVGYFTLSDIFKKKNIKLLNLNSKIILIFSIILVIIPSLIFTFLTDRGNISFIDALFMSTASRTTGLSIVDFKSLSENTLYLIAQLMFIGGAPGSMAGGLKVTTLAALMIAIRAIILDRDPQVFKRRISWQCINQAMAVFSLFLLVLLFSVFTIKLLNNDIGVFNIFFDLVSAFSTTGFSLSVGTYDVISNYILIFLMFAGRIGPLTIASLLKYTKVRRILYIEDDIAVG